MAQASKETTLHFFGDGKGESIALDTPLGWGVIDCFTYQDRVPVLEYLRDRGVSSLRFLAITHPHADHFLGMDILVEHFLARDGIQAFWRYPALDVRSLFPLLKARSESKPEPFRSLDLQSLDSLQRTYQLLIEPINARRTELTPVLLGSSVIRDESEQFFVDAVSPPGSMILEAEQALADHILSNEHSTPAKRWDLNKLSVALRVRHRGQEVLLGADTPWASWRDCFRSSSWIQGTAETVKCPHHGSDKDNRPEVLQALSLPDRSVSVVTRYSPSRLPRAKALRQLDRHYKRVIVLGKEIKQPTALGVLRKRREFTIERLDVPIGYRDAEALVPVSL